MAKDPYPTGAQLVALVLRMYRAAISYSEAVREFKQQFVLTVLRDLNWNETKAAQYDSLTKRRNDIRAEIAELGRPHRHR